MTPATLRTAYSLPETTPGSGSQTVGIVDAYDDPTVEADLDTFSTMFGLPILPPCSVSVTTSCFEKVNQSGATTGFPRFNGGWSKEIALDVETVHALCEDCKIVLVEATTNSLGNLAASVDTAASLGATVISNSYGAAESGVSGGAFSSNSKHYRKPGIVIVASAGDAGWGSMFPADVNSVVSVGGTTLSTDPSTGAYIGESVWFRDTLGTGSGCSTFDTVAPWQAAVPGWSATGCGTMRGIADVSADADPETGLKVWYDGNLYAIGGTSLSAPIIAATYALAANPPTTLVPSAVPYEHATGLHDVTSGTNTSSACPSTICSAAAGYDGPTGLGTPDGLSAFVDTGGVPAKATPPSISGTAAVGQQLSGSLGTWWATQAVTLQRSWLTCTTSCAPTGSTGPTYTVRSSDIGHTLELLVTATDPSGPATTSVATGVVPGVAPTDTAAPAISGTAAVGQTLTSTLGTWTGTLPITKTRVWLRCAVSCTTTGATGASYIVRTADIGDTLEVEVTASNAWGTSAPAFSATTAEVPGQPPANSAAPTISGTAEVGRVLTGTRGTWTGTAPITYTYQWKRCAAPTYDTCTSVPTGGRSLGLTIPSSDAGYKLELEVTATNAWGQASTTSAPTGVVTT